MIPPENEEWHGVVPPVEVSVFNINRSRSQLTIFYTDILNSMIKSSSDKNLTEAKIANELIMSVQSLNILHLNLLK